MKTCPAILLLCALLAFPVLQVGAGDLEIFADITRDDETGGGYLNLYITNGGEDEQTVVIDCLTDAYEQLEEISISHVYEDNPTPWPAWFDFRPQEVTEEPDRLELRPPSPNISTVALGRFETVRISTELSAEFMQSVDDDIRTNRFARWVHIRYIIDEDLAKTYDLWQGTLEMKSTSWALLRDDPSQPTGAAEPTTAATQ